MKKTDVLWIVLNSIFLIIFNTLFYVLGGTDHKASVWLSYVFIHFAYLMLIITPMLIRKGKSKAVFGFSMYSISTWYFLAQFVIGIIFIFIGLDSVNVPLLVQLCLVGLYAILFIANMIANERTAEAEEQRETQISYIKDSAIRLKAVLDRVKDKTVKKSIEKLYDTLYTSPVKTHPDLEEIEKYIILTIGELERAAYDGDEEGVATLAGSILEAVIDRNTRLKAKN